MKDSEITIKKNSKLVYMLIIFMVAVYPFIVVPGPLDYFRGPRYIVLVIVAMISLFLLARERVQFKDFSYYFLALFLVFALISTLLAEDVTTAWLGSPN